MVLNQPTLLILAAGALWLIGLSVWVYKTASHYSRLTTGSGKNLKQILEKLLEQQEEAGLHIKKLEESLGELGRQTQKHIQRVGLVRFNPYAETGGDQSFALALLDKAGTGIILLSLHGREGTRVYLKPVKEGRSRYELSKEEQQAIAQALKS